MKDSQIKNKNTNKNSQVVNVYLNKYLKNKKRKPKPPPPSPEPQEHKNHKNHKNTRKNYHH
jgi:hypothetical protein